MLQEKGNRCGICQIEADLLKECLHIDHCHTTGKVRGLLCRSCNLGLGFFRDSPELMNNASLYLEKSRGAPDDDGC